MKHRRWMILCALVVGGVTGARATGTIDQTGATLAVGSSSGSPGTLLVDPCAEGGTPPGLPPIEPLGTLGTMTNLPPAFPGGGTGADGAFAAIANQTLPGGTYNHTTYDVAIGVTVTYTGAVTIRTTGLMNLIGSIATTADNAPITIRCGQQFSMGESSLTAASVTTTGASSPIVIDAVVAAAYRAEVVVSTTSGNITLITHGTGEFDDGGLSLDRARIRTVTGDIALQGSAVALANSSEVEAQSGTVLVQAYAGGLTFVSSSFARTAAGTTTIEAATYLRFFYQSFAFAEGGDVFITSFQQSVEFISASYASAFFGNVAVRAAQYAIFTESSYARTEEFGDIAVTAFGADVWIEPPIVDGCSYLESIGGISVRASGNVFLNGDSYFNAANRDIVVRAAGGDVSLSKSPSVSAPNGAIDMRAFNAILATNTEVFPTIPGKAAPNSTITLDAVSIALSAGAGGIDLPLEFAKASGGALRAISQGPVAVGGAFTAEGDLTLASCDGAVDIVSATLRTDDNDATGGDTADILVASYAGSSGSIAAANAVVRSGDANGASGSVTLAVYDAAWGTTPTIESFFLPKRIVVKRNVRTPAKSRLVAVGFFDTGPGVVDLTKPARLDVGAFGVDVPGLTRATNGKSFRYQADGVDFLVKPSRAGSSRAKFKLAIVKDLSAQIPLDATLALHFKNDAVDAVGTVKLTEGKYSLGHKRGALIAPNLYVARSKITLAGGGADKLKLLVGLATNGVTPATAADLTVRIGDSFTRTIPKAEFDRKGDKYVFKGNVEGITSAVLDYKKETILVNGKGLDLGAYDDGPVPIFVSVFLGADERSNRVRGLHTGKLLKY